MDVQEGTMAEKYPVLRFTAKAYRILGWLAGLIYAVQASGILVEGLGRRLLPGEYWHFMIRPAVEQLLLAGLAVLTGLSAAEAIRVFLDIEENTRHGTKDGFFVDDA
jgi:hypothetical protein